MDPKLENFLKEMRSMEYSEDKAKNPAPNGITAAEIEALSTKAYSNCEPMQDSSSSLDPSSTPQAPPPPPPPEAVSYWQALVDPNTNLTYYWNSMTNEVSWTIPEGGVIALPMSAEQAEAREKEVELVMESYPYPATIAAEYTKAVVTTSTAGGAKESASSSAKSGTKRAKEDSSPSRTAGGQQQPELQPSLKKPRLQTAELGHIDNCPTTSVPQTTPGSVTGTSERTPVAPAPAPQRSLPLATITVSESPKPPVLADAAFSQNAMGSLMRGSGVLARGVSEERPSPVPTAQSVSQEDMMKVQVNNMVAMLSNKLKHLQSSTTLSRSMQLDTLAIQLQTRQADWKEGGVATKYMLEKLKKMNEDIFMFETSLFPEDWNLSTSDSEAAVGAPQSVAPSSVEDEQVASSIEAPCSPAIEKDSPIAPPSPHTESEGAVVKSTGEMECSESPDAPHSEVVYAENLVTNEDGADSPSPSGPSEILVPSPSLPIYVFPEAKVEPETGMPEGEGQSEDYSSGMGVAGTGMPEGEGQSEDYNSGMGVTGTGMPEGEGQSEDYSSGMGVTGRLDDTGMGVTGRLDDIQYERIVEDVSDKEEEEDEERERMLFGSNSVHTKPKEEENVQESEEEGIWVEPGKERSEGELLDDSDSCREEGRHKEAGKEPKGTDSSEQFGPKEESSMKKKVVDSYEKSEGELDQDSDDEKSEGELDDDKDEVWQEKAGCRADKESHSNRRQHYRTRTAHEEDSDYSDHSSSRRGRKDRHHYDSDCSDDYYSSSRKSRHGRDRKGRDRSRDRSRDRYRDDSDYSDDYYSSSRRNHRGRYGDKYERDYYRTSHYNKLSRSSKGYGGGGSSRHHHSHYSYDSDAERDHDNRRRLSSSKHKRQEREREKDKKRKHDYRGASGNKDSGGEEKKPIASVLIGKVGKIGTVRLLGKEKKAEEEDATGSGAAPLPAELPIAPPPMPPMPPAEVPQMSATYYQQPTTGEVPYYASYSTSYQYPAYSTTLTYTQPQEVPPQPQQEEVDSQQGWVWITNADGTPQWVRADATTGASTEQGTEAGAGQENAGTSLERPQKWGKIDPSQWGGADPVQWASAHASVSPEPVEPVAPNVEGGQDSTETGKLDIEEEEEGAGGDKMCSSKESLDNVQQETQETAVPSTENGDILSEQPDATSGVPAANPISEISQTVPSANPISEISQTVPSANPISEISRTVPVVEDTAALLDQPQSVDKERSQNVEEIAECEMELESDNGSPVAAALEDTAASAGEGSGLVMAGESEVHLENHAAGSGEQVIEQAIIEGTASKHVTSQAQFPAATEDAPSGAPIEYTAAETTQVGASEPAQFAAVGGLVDPAATEHYSDPSVSTDPEASAIQAATISSSSATYYPSSTVAPPTDAVYSYAAAYGQPAYNYAYAPGYNYAYVQQAAAASYGAYGMQPGASAYYQGMYTAPGTAVYGTYPTYYAPTSYSAVPPPTYPPPPTTVGAEASSATDGKPKKGDFSQSGSKEKQIKTMMEQWTAFKEGEGKS